jgi:hypothetical protein
MTLPMRLFFIILSFLCSSTYADTLGIHAWSHHTPSNSNQNNANFGLYWQTGQYEIGYYKNTLRRNSFYAGYRYQYQGIDFIVGGITGYKREHCQCEIDGFSPWVISPIIVPSKVFTFQNFSMRVSVVPNFSPFSPIGVIHSSIEIPF